MFPQDRKDLQDKPVAVEYDKGSSRATKQCDNAYSARQFYVTKLKAGKNPKIVPVPPMNP